MVTAKDGMQQAEAPYSQGHDVREASETATKKNKTKKDLSKRKTTATSKTNSYQLPSNSSN